MENAHMAKDGILAAAATLLTFAIYVGNVVSGAVTGQAFLSDIWEMLMLFFSSVCFVAFVLQREHKLNKEQTNQ